MRPWASYMFNRWINYGSPLSAVSVSLLIFAVCFCIWFLAVRPTIVYIPVVVLLAVVFVTFSVLVVWPLTQAAVETRFGSLEEYNRPILEKLSRLRDLLESPDTVIENSIECGPGAPANTPSACSEGEPTTRIRVKALLVVMAMVGVILVVVFFESRQIPGPERLLLNLAIMILVWKVVLPRLRKRRIDASQTAPLNPRGHRREKD